MRSHIQLGQIFGIRIGLHFSWLLIAALMVISLSSQFHATNPGWSRELAFALGVVTAILFFFSLLLHELAHSLVARASGLPVKEITLFALGGVSQISKEAASARTEFWMTFVGPVTSALIGTLCLAVSRVVPSGWHAVTTMFSWLGYINLGLAVFNLVPGYPLDGGRILRAAVWWRTGDPDRATRIAAQVGQFIAVFFILFGVGEYIAGGGFNGIWIAFIGWFLLQAAGESRLQAGLRRSLEGVRVADVMSHDCPVVDGFLNLQNFVDQELLRTGRRCFFVMENGNLAGLITPHEVSVVDRPKWPFTTVDNVMLPLEEIRTITPDATLENALELMGGENLNQIPVVSGGEMKGLLTRSDIVNYFQTRAELHL